MIKKIVLGLVGVAASLTAALGQTTTVSFDSGSQMLFNQITAAMNPLTGGTAADGDGAVLQLGYFSSAAAGNNFAGMFIPLSGEGSANFGLIPGSLAETYDQTSVGDQTINGAGDGTFALTLNFTMGNPSTGNNLPAAGTPLSIRFYNGTSIAGSTFFNTVSNNAWTFKTPTTPPSNVTISLDDAGIVFESIAVNGQAADTAFHTTIAIPEPSTYALMAFGVTGLLLLSRRKQRLAS